MFSGNNNGLAPYYFWLLRSCVATLSSGCLYLLLNNNSILIIIRLLRLKVDKPHNIPSIVQFPRLTDTAQLGQRTERAWLVQHNPTEERVAEDRGWRHCPNVGLLGSVQPERIA
jgi:hypothetical protein